METEWTDTWQDVTGSDDNGYAQRRRPLRLPVSRGGRKLAVDADRLLEPVDEPVGPPSRRDRLHRAARQFAAGPESGPAVVSKSAALVDGTHRFLLPGLIDLTSISPRLSLGTWALHPQWSCQAYRAEVLPRSMTSRNTSPRSSRILRAYTHRRRVDFLKIRTVENSETYLICVFAPACRRLSQMAEPRLSVGSTHQTRPRESRSLRKPSPARRYNADTCWQAMSRGRMRKAS